MRTRLLPGTIATALVVSAIACSGGGSPSVPSAPSGGGSTAGTPVSTTTITITATGASPRNITVSPGSRVTFINNDSRAHDMTSNPHPEHTDCPPLNDVGFLGAGQQKTSGNLNTVRTCGFHDHNDPGNTSLTGTIRIQ